MATLQTLIAQINKMETEVKKLKDENQLIKKELKAEKEKPDNSAPLKLSIDQIKLDLKKALANKYDDKNILFKLKSVESGISEANKPNDIIELNSKIKKLNTTVDDIKKIQLTPKPKVNKQLSTEQVSKIVDKAIVGMKQPVQITVNEINKMICDKINNIKQVRSLTVDDIELEVKKHVNEKFITNLYRNK